MNAILMVSQLERAVESNGEISYTVQLVLITIKLNKQFIKIKNNSTSNINALELLYKD
jgi:hypothetical protein